MVVWGVSTNMFCYYLRDPIWGDGSMAQQWGHASAGVRNVSFKNVTLAARLVSLVISGSRSMPALVRTGGCFEV